MFAIKQHICYPGNPSQPNEDIVGFGKDYCFVMDGASCLRGVEVMVRGSDAAWLVEQVASGLCRGLDAGDARSTEDILLELLTPLREKYLAALAEKGMEEPDDSPSAGFALFRKRKGFLEFFGLGDCVGTAALPGELFYSLDTNLPALDDSVLKQMFLLHRQKNIPLLQARPMCNHMLLANRKKRNHPGGYWVLDLNAPEAVKNARQFRWELTGPVAVAAFSDGFAQLCEAFGFYDGYLSLFAAMQKEDLEVLYRQLFDAQAADPNCNQHPRFKLRDDTCALWGIFTP